MKYNAENGRFVLENRGEMYIFSSLIPDSYAAEKIVFEKQLKTMENFNGEFKNAEQRKLFKETYQNILTKFFHASMRAMWSRTGI